MYDNSNLHKMRIFFFFLSLPFLSCLLPPVRGSVLRPGFFLPFGESGGTADLGSVQYVHSLQYLQSTDLEGQSGNFAAHRRRKFKMFLCQTGFRGREIVADLHQSVDCFQGPKRTKPELLISWNAVHPSHPLWKSIYFQPAAFTQVLILLSRILSLSTSSLV